MSPSGKPTPKITITEANAFVGSSPDPRLIVPQSKRGQRVESTDHETAGSSTGTTTTATSSAASTPQESLKWKATSRISPKKPMGPSRTQGGSSTPLSTTTTPSNSTVSAGASQTPEDQQQSNPSPPPPSSSSSSSSSSSTAHMDHQSTHHLHHDLLNDESQGSVQLEDARLLANDWRNSVVQACLQQSVLAQSYDQLLKDFDSLEKTTDGTIMFKDGYDREIELDIHEFVIFKAISSDPKFVFNHLRLAFNIMDFTGQEKVSKKEFVKYAPLLNICDVISAGKIFTALTGGENQDDVLLYPEFDKYVTALRKGYRVNKKWEDLKAKLHFEPNEVLLQYSSGVADHTDFSLGHPGLLFLSNQHVYLESTILRRGKIMDLGSIASVHKRKIGIFAVDNGIEIVGEDPTSKHVIISFNKDRDRWFSYLEEMVHVHRRARQLQEQASGDVQDGQLDAIPYMIDVATHNIIRSRAIFKATNTHTNEYFLCNAPLDSGDAMAHGGTNTDMMWSYKLFRGFISNFTENEGENEDDIDQDEPFQYKKFIGNIDTLIMLLDPIISLFTYINNILVWKSISTSLLYLLFCLYAVHNDLLGYVGVLVCLLNAILVGWNGFDHLLGSTMIISRASSQQESEPQKEKTSVFTILRIIQNTVQDINIVLIKIRNLYAWRVPWMSRVFFSSLMLLGLIMIFLPFRFIFLVLVLNAFTLNNLFARFPKFRKNYDIVGQFWNQVPSTMEAIEDPQHNKTQ